MINSWQGVRSEVLRRIHSREWAPGSAIPNEAALAEEFGCARATVNRALRTLAESGILDRRRKAGTRVAQHPVPKARLEIPVIRREVEAGGAVYGYDCLEQARKDMPDAIARRLSRRRGGMALHIMAVHTADESPYVIEERWINDRAVSGLSGADFSNLSANEWLITHAPFTHGDITFSAVNASESEADILNVKPGAALFVLDRTTWDGERAITTVRMIFAPGYQLQTHI